MELQPSFPPEIDGIKAEPDPDWTFDELLKELASLDLKLSSSSSLAPHPFTNRNIRYVRTYFICLCCRLID